MAKETIPRYGWKSAWVYTDATTRTKVTVTKETKQFLFLSNGDKFNKKTRKPVDPWRSGIYVLKCADNQQG